MPQYYGLSETEKQVMEMIWESGRPLSFYEIMEYFTVQEKRGWKKQTMHTYLARLMKKGALKSSGTVGKHIYEPAVAKEEYIRRWTSDFLKESFDGSLRNFMLALTGNGNHLSREEIEELRQFLDEEGD